MPAFYGNVEQGGMLFEGTEIRSGWWWDGSAWSRVFLADPVEALYEWEWITNGGTYSPPAWAHFMRASAWGGGGGGNSGNPGSATAGTGGEGASVYSVEGPAGAVVVTLGNGGLGAPKNGDPRDGEASSVRGAVSVTAGGGAKGDGWRGAQGGAGGTLARKDGVSQPGGSGGGQDTRGSQPGGGGGGGKGGIFGRNSVGQPGGAGGAVLEYWSSTWSP